MSIFHKYKYVSSLEMEIKLRKQFQLQMNEKQFRSTGINMLNETSSNVSALHFANENINCLGLVSTSMRKYTYVTDPTLNLLANC